MLTGIGLAGEAAPQAAGQKEAKMPTTQTSAPATPTTAPTTGPVPRTPELIWLGDGAWVACDGARPADDPSRVIAYVECKDHLVYVLPARASAEVRTYPTIRDALRALAATLHPSVRP